MFYINKEHENHYRYLLELFPVAKMSVEYQVACYITAVPTIFSKIDKNIEGYEYPLDWINNWHDKYTEKEEFESDVDYLERSNINIDYDLSFSMQELGRLALNLFNRYENFNLMTCLNSLDDNNIEVLKTAIDIRLGKYIE